MNSIHPSAQIIGDVVFGQGNMVGPSVVIIGPVVIGDDNWFGTGTVVGAPPEVRDWPHPRNADELSSGNGIEIGDSNVFREYSQVHQGWHDVTRIGDRLFAMNQIYIAHDCQIEDDVTLASSVLLAGHVRIGRGANLGLGASVHQRRYVGGGSMVGMGSVVTRDIPPFAKAFGNPARVRGVNAIGMERAGIDPETIAGVASLYSSPFTAEEVVALGRAPGLESAVDGWRRHVIESVSD